MKNIKFIIFYYLLFVSSTYAFRSAPKEVKPVVYKNIEYRAPTGKMEYVEAWDITTGKILWEKRIYSVFSEPFIEADVFWVYITDLKIVNEQLIITNESNNKYALDLDTKKVTLIVPDEFGNVIPRLSIEDVIKKTIDFLADNGVSSESFERKEYFINSASYDRKTKKWKIFVCDDLFGSENYLSIPMDDKTGEIDTDGIERITLGENPGDADNNTKETIK